jgi:hypothetical protein
MPMSALTGTVPIADEDFATLQEGSLLNGVLTAVIVLFILWLAGAVAADRSAIVVSLLVGLAVTAAVGPVDGWRLQSNFTRIRGAVRRTRCRLFHPVQHPVSRSKARRQ